MSEETWDTKETCRWVKNDEWVYNHFQEIMEDGDDLGALAEHVVTSRYPTLNEGMGDTEVDYDNVDWQEVANCLGDT